MKKHYSFLSLILCLCFCLQGCSDTSSANGSYAPSKEGYLMEQNEVNISYENEKKFLSQMELVCENQKYSFYYDKGSLSIALVDKRDSQVYFSNPYDAGKDSYYVDDLKNRLNSQIVLDYVDRVTNVKEQLFSSSDCVELGQYGVSLIDDGLNIKMTIGEIKEEFLAPEAMTEETFEKFVSKMDDLGRFTMETFYSLTSADELEGGLEKQELLEKFPLLKKEKLYIAVELTERDQEIISDYLIGVGYTQSDYEKDLSLVGADEETAADPSFELELQYRLSEQGLTVTIPSDSIKYDNENFAITDICVLEFFASDKPEKNGDGYLFIPDGSGALINIDSSNENRKRSIGGDIYGRDLTLSANEIEEGETFLLPVFGINKNDGSCLFAEIISGDEISTVLAALGEPSTQYFRVYNTFRFNSHEKINFQTKVGSQNSNRLSYKVSETSFKGDLSIRYTPLTGKGEGYVKMAQYYRQQLISYGLKPAQENTKLKTEINLLGTAVGDDTFLGINVKNDFVFTDYSSAMDVVDWFGDKGIDNLRLVYTGWQNRGLNAGAAGKQKVSAALGGKSQWKKLNEYLDEKSIDLIPATDLVFSSYQYAFDGFSKSGDSARTMKDSYAGVYKYENVNTDETLNYLISPVKYNKLWKKFFKSADKLVTNTLLLENVGAYLASDAKHEDTSNRSVSLKTMNTVFGEQSKEKKLWFNGGNKYVLPFAEGVTETILNNSGFAGETASVPFYQLVTDGLVARSSRDINLSMNWEQELLSCVETHTSPRFTLAYENTELLKDTDFTKYYSVDFEILRDRMAEDVSEMNEKLECIDGEFITNHKILADGVTITTYSNGYSVLVNKTAKAYNYSDVKVNPVDYVVITKGEG